MEKLFNWIINKFTYIQIYILICLLFLASLLPIVYFWIETHLNHVHAINIQLDELAEEKILEQLFGLVQQHRLLTQRHLIEKKDHLQEIESVQEQINDLLKQLSRLTLSERGYLKVSWKKVYPRDLALKWNNIVQKLSILPPFQLESLHNALLHDMVIQFGYLADRVEIVSYGEIEKFILVGSVFLGFPLLQENLAKLILFSEEAIYSAQKQHSYEEIASLIDIFESDLDSFNRGIEANANAIIELKRDQILVLLTDYQKAVTNLIQTIRNRILSEPKPTISLSEFQIESESALRAGYNLWDLGLQILKEIVEQEKTNVLIRLWSVLFATILLTGFTFFTGLRLIYSGIIRLSEMTQITNRFTNGDLSARVPNSHQDEIGRQAQAFNQMAQKLEEMINRLYELLNANSALANGNLTARIQIHDKNENDTEFNQVALSFNTMAERFETIIRRLQQIGSMLTSSASEIAGASKEQEDIVIKQEATTREIADAANEISYTAKEFAKTMNEVSQTVEQTSDLALKGKDSLHNMELIMSNMVEASTSIAAKLAILNEKANNITSVITTITKVADQTNLLSLNASIEAEKAGEYGRSFAVIAREIRRLADQTAIATLDIEKNVNEMMSAVASSVMGVDEFRQEIRNGVGQVRTVNGQLATIIERVQAFTTRFELINEGMQAQSTGAEQINEALGELSQTARQTSEAIHQFHKTVQELNQAANELSILNPFASKEEPFPIVTHPIKHSSPQAAFKEPKREFSKTISNLNVTTHKLKDLNKEKDQND